MARTDEMDAHIKEIIDLGFKRILTSGTKVSALEGQHVIQRLQQSYGDKILIMPGAGINEDNLGEILRFTGVREFHGSAGMKQHSEMKFKNELFEGTNEYATKVTDEEKVKNMVGVFESIRK